MIRAGNHAARTLLVLPRHARAFLSLIGLTAVIAGILAMHVWMGAQGSMTHHAGGSASTMPTSTMIMAGRSDAAMIMTPVSTSEVLESARGDAAAMAADIEGAMMSFSSSYAQDGMLAGCGDDCADEMAVGMCVLVIIAASIAGLLLPVGRALVSSLIRRGPPSVRWESRPRPAPSLTHLCISRT